jgi:hypothetical protein
MRLVEDVAVTVADDPYKKDQKRSTIVLPRGYEIRETWCVVDTDNFGGDYPNERFVAFGMSEREAQNFADAANKQMGENAPRFLNVVKHIVISYVLAPGFEP